MLQFFSAEMTDILFMSVVQICMKETDLQTLASSTSRLTEHVRAAKLDVLPRWCKIYTDRYFWIVSFQPHLPRAACEPCVSGRWRGFSGDNKSSETEGRMPRHPQPLRRTCHPPRPPTKTWLELQLPQGPIILMDLPPARATDKILPPTRTTHYQGFSAHLSQVL